MLWPVVRVVLTTGYDENVILSRYAALPRCSKPITRQALAHMLDEGA